LKEFLDRLELPTFNLVFGANILLNSKIPSKVVGFKVVLPKWRKDIKPVFLIFREFFDRWSVTAECTIYIAAHCPQNFLKTNFDTLFYIW
jgi:hypothetical protein